MTAKKALKGATKRKVKVFVILLICSFGAWLISQLSETYTERITFELSFTNAPDSLMLMNASEKEITLSVRGSGWQFLSSRFTSGELPIDLSKVSYARQEYFLPNQSYRDQIEAALPANMTVVQMGDDTLFLNFSRLVSKKIPVYPNVGIQLAQNYLLDGPLKVVPDSVVLTGPEQELDTLERIYTEQTELTGIDESFSRTLKLVQPESLTNTRFDVGEIQLSAEVFRFSEKIFEVAVDVINLPEGTQIRTFPNSVEVLCKARLEVLKDLTAADFKAIADLEEVKENSAFLRVRLVGQPEGVPSSQLLQDRVEFILKRE